VGVACGENWLRRDRRGVGGDSGGFPGFMEGRWWGSGWLAVADAAGLGGVLGG